MTKFYDNHSVLTITIKDPNTGEDFSQAFFDDATNAANYNENMDAFKVEDVEYLVDYAKDYVAGKNGDFDYPDDYNPEESPLAYLDYSVEPRETEVSDLEADAAALYDGGWRAEDRDEIQRNYDLSDHDVEIICQKLAEYAER